ncbi:MAG: hypothetical protein JST93_28745 [Acidobacteria bacterium]|nr:hypothetical protein [Acidobacteriota bacterium]
MAQRVDVSYTVSGDPTSLLALRTKIEHGAPGQFTMRLHERKSAAREGFGQTEIADLIISAVAGGAAKAAVDYLLVLLKDAGKKQSVRRKKRAPTNKRTTKATTKKATTKRKKKG